MSLNKQKKVALVTGASSGMGKEIAKRLIQDGFVVYAAARQVDKMDDLAKLGANLSAWTYPRKKKSRRLSPPFLSRLAVLMCL